MRVWIAMGIGIGLVLGGVMAGLVRRSRSRRIDLGAVSGQWVAEQQASGGDQRS